MATTVAQHQLTPYTDPQNGQTPIDADQVTANDNASVTGYNAHDADPGIHLQSSLLASRPAAGTAGRNWLVTDTMRLYHDDGADWQEVAYLPLDSATLSVVTGDVEFQGAILANTIEALGGFVGDLTGNADTATALATARDIAISGDITAAGVAFDGTGNITLVAGITAGAIVNADINAAAAIVDTKLATISTAGKVSNSATTAASTNTASAIVARDGSGNFAAGTITVSGLIHTGTSITLRNVAYVLPAADGSAGQVLSTDGAGNLSWAAASAGFVTGSGTTGTLPKFTSSSGLGDSIIVEASGMIRIGTTPGTAGILGLPNNAAISARNAGNSANITLITLTAGNVVQVGDSSSSVSIAPTGSVTIGQITTGGFTLTASDGTNGQVLTTNGSGTVSWQTPAGGGGVDGSGFAGTIAVWSDSDTIGNSILAQSGSVLTVSDTVNAVTQFNVNGTKVVGARDTGWAAMAGGSALKDASGADIGNITSAVDFNDAQATIEALANQVKALVTVLIAHGLIGA